MNGGRIVLDENQIRAIVKDTVRETVKEMFTQFGIDVNQPLEVQKDFQHLNGWRKSTESVKRQGLIVAITILVTGALGILYQNFGSGK